MPSVCFRSSTVSDQPTFSLTSTAPKPTVGAHTGQAVSKISTKGDIHEQNLDVVFDCPALASERRVVTRQEGWRYRRSCRSPGATMASVATDEQSRVGGPAAGRQVCKYGERREGHRQGPIACRREKDQV